MAFNAIKVDIFLRMSTVTSNLFREHHTSPAPRDPELDE